MNFVGKFDAQLPSDGFTAHSHVQVEHPTAHAPADAIIVPDAHLLFGADFKRAGVDLILSNADRELVVHDYFKGEHRHPLASPDGAHLTGDIVNALTGQVQYAQAGAPDAAAHVIGHVTKLTGSATAVRNGVSVILNNGDNVEKGDVVATGSDSTLGVTFIDGTVFGLSSNARMVLNEMVYDPNGSNNSSLISLVAGTISFVAGETAKHGDMKVDTPVATMGIRGTAVLVEIDFNVPGQNGLPDAKFQVLVEPDGTTGSYILFDKTTLDPIATVNRAGQQVNINQNGISYSNSPLTPELQKLISDVFSQKFSSNDSNTKSFDHLTDSIVPLPFQGFKGPDGITVTPVFLQTNSLGTGPSQNQGPGPNKGHVDVAPTVGATSGGTPELPGVTGSPNTDKAIGSITFGDVNLGDQPTASAAFHSFTYQDAHHHDISLQLTPTELAAVQAVEVALDITQDPSGLSSGTAHWAYNVSDAALDFLGQNETLTLTYYVTVSNNFAQSILTTTVPILITITGTNDVPKIDSVVPQTIAFHGGTNVPGGDLIATVPTSGKIAFDDPDLTDTHTVSVAAPTSTLTDPVTGITTPFTLPPKPLAIFDQALTASLTDPATGLPTDSTGTGHGSISWSLAELPVWLGDYIPEGEILTLTYTVTVTDSQGATATQDITVTITGTAAPAEVWTATTGEDSTPDGLWSTGVNWETGLAPTSTDDVIIITNQLEGLTPTYPVTITSAVGALGAAANSITMDNFGGSAPLLINQVKLAVGGDFDINDHSTDNPVGYTGPEFDNQVTGTVTIGGAFNLNADAVVHNAGSIAVTGKMEALDQSTVQNSGTIKLADGGDFGGQSTISNTIAGALIEVTGGTLNVDVDISNLGTVKIDPLAALTLSSAAINGGIVTNDGTLTLNGSAVVKNGMLGNSGQINVSGTGNALDNEQVTNTGGIEVLALGALTLDLLTGVTNTGHTITVDGTEDGTGTLTLQGGGSITGGTLANAGTVDIEGSGATLDGVTITGTGAINVDVSAQTTLVIEGTSSITGNKLTVGPTGVLSDAGSLTLDHVGVTNKNSIEITAGNALTLDDGTSVDNTAGTIAVDGTATLTLNDAGIDGGTINNFSSDGESVTAGNIDVTGASTISNAHLNNGDVTVENATLTLNGVNVHGSAIDAMDAGSLVKLENTTIAGATLGTGHLTDANSGLFEVEATTGANTSILDGSTDAVSVAGYVRVDAGANLELIGTIHNSGTIDIDPAVSTPALGSLEIQGAVTLDGGGTVTLDGPSDQIVAASGGGTLDNYETISGNGSIGHAGDGALALHNESGGLIVATGGALTIDTGTTFINDGIIEANSGGTLVIDDAVTGTGSATLNGGTLEIGAGATDAQAVTFGADGGKLQIDQGGSFSGSIAGLVAGDQIDLSTIGYGLGTTGTYVGDATGGTLTVTDGTNSVDLHLVGDYTGAHFAGSADSNGDLLITLHANDDPPIIPTADKAETATLNELASTTGSAALDPLPAASGAIHFTDIDLTDRPTADVKLSVTWTNGTTDFALTQPEISALESAFLLTQSGNTNNGTLNWTYQITDSALDFLGAGETATVTAAITLDDHQGITDAATVTVTIGGSNDAPVLAADISGANGTGLHAIPELAGKTGDTADIDSASGSLSFTDVDLTDTHKVTESVPTYVWSGGSLTTAQTNALTSAATLALTETDSTHTGSGSIGFNYSAADSSFDFLAAGETLTVTYDITVTDKSGVSSTQPVSFTVTGSNDAPVLAADTSGTNGTGLHSIAEIAGKTGDATDIDSASGTLSFTDVDLDDTHTVAKSAATYAWSGGTLTPAQISALNAAGVLALTETDSTHTGAGSIGFSYSAADSTFDFLAAGATLTVTYDITVTDHSGASSMEPVTFTITGSNDAPTIASEANPTTQTIILSHSPIVLSAGVSTNSLGLPTETFDESGITAGSASNNGAGHGNFTNTALGATFSGTGDAGVVHGSSSVSAPPFIGPSPGHADTTNYLSIGANGSETITFATEQNEFGLYWGSVDSFNAISFYDGTQLVATYTGAAIAPLLANGNQGSFSANGYVEFSDLAPFTKVVLTSGSSNAFEIDNISAGFVSDSHVHLAGPITGTITVNDADIGDTLTASVTGNATALYNGSTTLPSGVNISSLIASGAITFDTVKTTGGQDVLDWTYNPANPNLDFLEPGDKLTLTFNATVSDGHATTATQALTVTLVGNGSSVVNGTAQNDTFSDVGGGVTITGHGGHDLYNFNAHFGSATITDFDVGNDVIDISSTLFSSVNALLNSAVNSGVNTVITDSAGDQITLDHVTAAQLKANPGDFQLTIANGATFEAAASTSENIVFEGSTGKLTIDTPSSFNGVISGFTGDGTLAGSDQIDLKGIDHNSASFTESFNAANDTLFVSDGTHNATLHFSGAYQAQNFSFTTDNNGGTIVYDPPVTAGAASDAGNTPPVSSNGHGFVFKFADSGHDVTGGNPPAADTHLFDSHLASDAGTALNKLHDDSHAVPPVIPSDGHDPSAAAAKAQWHASDFHFA